MLNLFSVNVKEGYVDLYYNDLVCLDKVINKINLEINSTVNKDNGSF
jgi:hypothetical protein